MLSGACQFKFALWHQQGHARRGLVLYSSTRHIQYLCLHARGVKKGPFSSLDVRIRWSEAPRFSQVPAWCGDVVSESMPNCQERRVFSARKHPIRQPSIDRSIVFVYYTRVFFFTDANSLGSCSWLRTGSWEDCARKKVGA